MNANEATTGGSVLLSDLDALRTLLSASGRCANAVLEPHQHEPAPGSEAAREMSRDDDFAGSWGPDPIFETWSLALGLLAVAEDHMRGLELLLAHDIDVAFPQLAVARAALECSARAFWLTEPSIGVKARIARGKNERIYGLEQQKKLGIEDATELAERRLGSILDGARDHGFDVADKGTPWIEEQRRPSATDAADALLPNGHPSVGTVGYRYFSACQHGTSFGVYQQFERVEGGDDVGSRTRASLVKRPTTSVNIACIVLQGYLRARTRQINAYGHNCDEWGSWVRHVFTAMSRVIDRPTI